jgi:hypothetical protein
MGEDDDELVHELPYQNEYNERLFGVSRITRRWNDGVLEY